MGRNNAESTTACYQLISEVGVIMVSQPYPNFRAVWDALAQYRDAMRPFIMSGLRGDVHGQSPAEAIYAALKGKAARDFQNRIADGNEVENVFDVNQFPHIIRHYWDISFRNRIVNDDIIRRNFGKWLHEIVPFRNETAHQPSIDMSAARARECLNIISQTLQGINALSANAIVQSLLKNIIEQAPNTDTMLEPVDSSINSAEGSGSDRSSRRRRSDNDMTPSPGTTSRKPWREVIQPRPEVIEGTLQQSEFAADLQQVYDGEVDGNLYGNPVLFFRNTYMTDGIRDLLTATLQRLAGKGGYPVVQAKTGFGGGKTHSLIALYHLVTSANQLASADYDDRDADVHEQIRSIMMNAGVSTEEGIKANISVLNGIHLSPTDEDVTYEEGDPLNTLWGVMAYQLGGQAGYDIIGAAAREGTAPGGRQLRDLFETVGPSVILMDEIINYARNISGDSRIESVYTFFQNITETVRQTNNVVIVMSLPESEVEVGDERAAEILRRLETILGRVEAVWRPVEDREGFEVIRRRLFRDETCDEKSREQTCSAFADMYNRRNNRTKFPAEVTDVEYVEQMKRCFPIHPEVFHRLYEDWSTYHNFQRTRGVLRIMALCVNRLYHQNDESLLIMPGDFPLSDPNVSGEFIRFLDTHWNPVLDEVDKSGSRTDVIDNRRNDFREIQPAKRMARTIFLGSVPVRPNPGLDDRHIYLGAVSPGSAINNFDAALRTMDENLYHLYRENGRHRFSSDMKLALVVNDRKGEFKDEDADDEIIRRLNETCSSHDIVICPDNSEDVTDKDHIQIVFLRPDQMRGPRNRETDKATPVVESIVQNFGADRRLFGATLRFVATTTDRVRPLRDAAKNVLVWNSIVNGERKLTHLSEQRQKEAQDGLANSQSDFDKALGYAYSYVAGPVEMEVSGTSESISWSTLRLRQGSQHNTVVDNISSIREAFQPPQREETFDDTDIHQANDGYHDVLSVSDAEPQDVHAADVSDHTSSNLNPVEKSSNASQRENITLSLGLDSAVRDALTEPDEQGTSAEVDDAPEIRRASPIRKASMQNIRLTFTPTDQSESLESRFIGNGLAADLREGGFPVVLTVSVALSVEIDQIPGTLVRDMPGFADRMVENWNAKAASYVMEVEVGDDLPDHIVQYMHTIINDKSYIRLETD